MDTFKASASLLAGLLPLIEKKIELLKVNPAVRDQVLVMSIVLGAMCGFGAYRSFRNSRKGVIGGSIAIAVTFVSFMFAIALINGISFGMDPLWISWCVKSAYLLTFAFLGVALGSFLSL